MNINIYSSEVLLSLFARGFHFCFCLIVTLYFIFLKRKKNTFSYLYALCGVMLMTSIVIGTLARFGNIEYLTLEVDSICDLAIVPAYAVFGYSLIKQSTKLWTILINWCIMELPIIISIIGYTETHDNEFVTGAMIYIVGMIFFALVWGFFQINRYNRLIKNSYSDIDNRSLTWFKFIIGGMIGFVIAYFVIGKYFNMKDTPAVQPIYFFGTEILILIMAYYVNKQEDVEDTILEESDGSVNKTDKEDEDTLIILSKRLKKDFEAKELYTRHNITIRDIANVLDSNTKYVSMCINHILGKNFNQYINELRIRKACMLMEKDTDINYDEIATAVGFNSKSTFWRIFEVIYGESPTKYRDNLNNTVVEDNEVIDEVTHEVADNADEGIVEKVVSITLTQREKELCRLIADGADTQKQCEVLGIKASSLRVMRSRLRTHLQLSKSESLKHFIIHHEELL